MQTNSEYQNQLLADGLIIKLVLVPLSHETDVGQWNRVFQVKQVGYQSFSFCDTLYIWDSETECNISDCLLQCYTCYSVTFCFSVSVFQLKQMKQVGTSIHFLLWYIVYVGHCPKCLGIYRGTVGRSVTV